MQPSLVLITGVVLFVALFVNADESPSQQRAVYKGKHKASTAAPDAVVRAIYRHKPKASAGAPEAAVKAAYRKRKSSTTTVAPEDDILDRSIFKKKTPRATSPPEADVRAIFKKQKPKAPITAPEIAVKAPFRKRKSTTTAAPDANVRAIFKKQKPKASASAPASAVKAIFKHKPKPSAMAPESAKSVQRAVYNRNPAQNKPNQAPTKFSSQQAVRSERQKRLAEGSTDSPLPEDPVLQQCSEDLYRLDQQGNAAVMNKNWAVDTRSRTGKLFTKLDKSVFEKPTYKAFIALLDNYEPTLGIAETVTPQEKQEESAFLDAILATPVMKKVYDCIKQKGLAPKDGSTALFKALLQKIWFTIYRRRGQPDTSGFEHAFVGEFQDGNTIGLHNWVQYATQEAAGKATYKSWKGQADPDFYGMQFEWQGKLKYKSTIAIGESPEMSIAVNTLCFLAAPNNECKLKMGGAPVSILTYRWDNRYPQEAYVASAYYV